MKHRTLDQLGPVGAARHLRHILVAHDILPRRDEQLHALERWLVVKLAEIGDTEERRLLRSYVTWSHLRRLRGKEKLTTPFQNASIRNEVKSAVKLLEFLRRRGRTLTDCTQEDLDQWCLQGDRMPLRARGFVAWCVERRHIESIRIPAQVVKPDREVFVDDEQRWDLVRRLLHDDSLATVDRVAGQLVLLYGQKVSRIIQLTIDDVTEADGLVQLRLGRHPLVIPDPLDQLILQLVDNRRDRPLSGTQTTTTGCSPAVFPASHCTHRYLPSGSRGSASPVESAVTAR